MAASSNPVTLLYKGEDFRIWDYACPGCDTHEHAPEVAHSFDLSFTRHGLYRVRVGSRRQVVNANHVIYFNRGEEFLVDHPVGGADASTVISLRPETLRLLLGEFRPRMLDIDSAKLRFHSPQTLVDGPLAMRHRELIYILRTRPSDHVAVESATLSLCELALSGETDQPSFRPATQRDYQERIEHLKTFIYAHLSTELRLADLAREAAFSPFHLTRVFRQITGVTLHRYIVALRLQRAMEALSTGQENLTALALDLGFPSHSHFTGSFRAYFGQTPSAFRAGQTAA